MNKPVTLLNKKTIIGISNIVVSEVDDTIYLNTQLQVDDGIKGGIAFYESDGHKISSRGNEFYYDADTQTLHAPFVKLKTLLAVEGIVADKITSTTDLTTKNVFCDFLSVKEINAEYTSITTKLKLNKKTVSSPIGKNDDVGGDVAIDDNFFYYCIKNYDGVSNIWKRIQLQEWQ